MITLFAAYLWAAGAILTAFLGKYMQQQYVVSNFTVLRTALLWPLAVPYALVMSVYDGVRK